jgi:xylonate dehydratase
LAYLQNGDRVRLDLNARTLNAMVAPDEWQRRIDDWTAPVLEHQTPWEELYREKVGQLADGGCLDHATKYQKIRNKLPRDSH